MRRRKAQKKQQRRKYTVCQACPLTPFDPVRESKPWNMKAEVTNMGGDDEWVVVKTCKHCGMQQILV